MPALQVRDFPEDLYEELKACAQREHRSIAQQTIYAVQTYLEMQDRRTAEWWRSANRIDEMSEEERRAERRRKVFARIDAREPHVVPDGFPTTAEIIREMRDSR